MQISIKNYDGVIKTFEVPECLIPYYDKENEEKRANNKKQEEAI